jgi:hypothetical protein
MLNDLIANVDKIRTTRLGIERVKRNLDLNVEDIDVWCRQKVKQTDRIIRKGKNWYVFVDNFVITINAHSYTLITAHKKANKPIPTETKKNKK